MFDKIRPQFRKIFINNKTLLPVLTGLILISGLFVAILASRENQDRRSRAEVIATVPGSYGYGIYGSDIYNGTVGEQPSPQPTAATSSGEITPTPTTSTPTPTEILMPTNTPAPTTVPTSMPTNTPTPTPTAVPTPTPTVVVSGNGLTGAYFTNKTLTGTARLIRIDPFVNYNWSTGSPSSLIPKDSFSTRWTGYVLPEYSETYTFYTQSDDGVRLWVNGVQIINNWTNHRQTENKGTIVLAAGEKYAIKMEYYESSGNSVAGIFWSSVSQLKQVIPQAQLYAQ